MRGPLITASKTSKELQGNFQIPHTWRTCKSKGTIRRAAREKNMRATLLL